MDQDANRVLKHEEESKCLYPSKPCTNPRGVKRNGELHNFCDFHRNKANFNQRRLEHKRKYQQEAAPQAISLPLDELHGLPPPLPSPHVLSDTPFQETALEPDDIFILQELLNSASPPTGIADTEHHP